jgi:hypothetical protein
MSIHGLIELFWNHFCAFKKLQKSFLSKTRFQISRNKIIEHFCEEFRQVWLFILQEPPNPKLSVQGLQYSTEVRSTFYSIQEHSRIRRGRRTLNSEHWEQLPHQWQKLLLYLFLLYCMWDFLVDKYYKYYKYHVDGTHHSYLFLGVQ